MGNGVPRNVSSTKKDGVRARTPAIALTDGGSSCGNYVLSGLGSLCNSHVDSFKDGNPRGWRHGLEVKRLCSSFKRPELNSQQPHGSL